MTGYEVVEQALILLNYTTPMGDTDNGLNAEQLRHGLPILNTVLADLLNVAGKPTQKLDDLQEELPLTEQLALLAAVPGVAMHLAQSADDGTAYNRWATEYSQRRRMAARPHGRVKDTVPYPVG